MCRSPTRPLTLSRPLIRSALFMIDIPLPTKSSVAILCSQISKFTHQAYIQIEVATRPHLKNIIAQQD